jgi:hypothetical protein
MASAPPASASEANFPVLIPHYTFRFQLGGPTNQVGGLTRGQPLTVVHLVDGSVTTILTDELAASSTVGDSGSSANNIAERVVIPQLNARVRGQGIDFVRNDPDGGRMRLDAGVVVE